MTDFAWSYWLQNRIDATLRASWHDVFQGSRSIHLQVGFSATLLARILQNLGLVVLYQRDHEGARALLERCAMLNQEQGNRVALSVTLNTLVELALELGNFDEAQSLLDRIAVLDQELGSAANCLSLQYHGLLALRGGDAASAQAIYEKDMELRREVGDTQSIAYAFHNLAEVRHIQKDYQGEYSLRREGLELFEKIGHSRGVMFGLEGLARLALVQSQNERAGYLWGASQTLRSKIGAPVAPADLQARASLISDLRMALGANFESNLVQGASLTTGEAITFALTGSPNRS